MVFGWVEETRPRVSILTDGSGRSGASRIASSERLLREVNAVAGTVWGAISDQLFYRAVLDGDKALFIDLAVRLGDELAETKPPYVAGDALEGFNPTHDICRMIIDAAVERARRGGAVIGNYAFFLLAPHEESPREGAIYKTLSDEGLLRKFAAARAYPEFAAVAEAALSGTRRRIVPQREDLAELVDRSMEGISARNLAIECLIPAGSAPVASAEPRFYEIYGERLVAAGTYQRAIRYREHVQPIERALAAL